MSTRPVRSHRREQVDGSNLNQAGLITKDFLDGEERFETHSFWLNGGLEWGYVRVGKRGWRLIHFKNH